eukprot:CAMPEP_0113289582 /NCGR_PEP_ID=MMETSP0008_2-20120614/32938_1 /TAXON_ID=97485 /ORGANISM="Prymnesium parvum" /LENGTH=698 /DNA_ID=CAMNT_0000141129 /DNA_START=56 /DNA_END=2153 /DNA_ORIENTATION=+ /assembly_acc=CAM_ASM_000153
MSKKVYADGEQLDAPLLKQLSCGTMAAYSFMRLPISAYDLLIRPARVTVYRETLGMSIKTQAMLVSACKSIDFLIGFFVGSLSDRTRTRWGRRKPFIHFMGPVLVICATLLANPPRSLGVPERVITDDDKYCERYVNNASISNSTSCAVLSACLQNSIAQGNLVPPLHPWLPIYNETSYFDQSSSGAGAPLALWFATFYFLYYATGATSVVIPYDALGMELTSDYNEKSKLFGIKATFQFSGYLFQTAIAVVLARMFPTSIITQVSIGSFILGAIMLLSIAVLVYGVRERPATPVTRVQVVPSVRRLFANRPYMMYLLFRIPMTIASLLPSNLIGDYIHYSIKVEDWNTLYSMTVATVILSIFFSIPFLVWAAKRYGKREVISYTCLFEGLLLLFCFFIPPNLMQGTLLFLLCGIVGFGMAAAFVIPDSVLADVIDYDELYTGERNEAIYTVVETNLQQFVEILGGVLPGVVAGLFNFRSNGGRVQLRLRRRVPSQLCAVGLPRRSWPRLLRRTGRAAAARAEPRGAVHRSAIRGAAGLPYLLPARPGAHVPLGGVACVEDVHLKGGDTQIMSECAKRKADPSYVATDPLTSKPVVPKSLTASDMFEAHFSSSEHALAKRRSGASTLKVLVCSRLALWLCAAAGIVAAVVITKGDEAIATFGSLALAALFVLIPWEYLRLRALAKAPTQSFSQSWSQI